MEGFELAPLKTEGEYFILDEKHRALIPVYMQLDICETGLCHDDQMLQIDYLISSLKKRKKAKIKAHKEYVKNS